MTTATTASRNREYVRGSVEAANDNGIRVAGVWYNWSRYPGGTRDELGGDQLAKGDVVELGVTSGRWIAEVHTSRPAEQPAAAPAPAAARPSWTPAEPDMSHTHPLDSKQLALRLERMQVLLARLGGQVEQLMAWKCGCEDEAYNYQDSDVPEWAA